MALSSDLISQFVKVTNDKTKTKTEKTVYGTVRIHNGSTYVQLDGSDLLTPYTSTAVDLKNDVKDGDRVTIMIKNHSATVTGNISSPAAKSSTVEEIKGNVAQYDKVMSHELTTDELYAVNAVLESLQAKIANLENIETVNADIENLKADFAEIDHISATDMEVISAKINTLTANVANITNISTEVLEAATADIDQLKAYTADFVYVSAEVLEATKADVEFLDANKLEADFANIKNANLDKAVMREFFASSGLIENVTMEDGTVTGYLVAVKIKGDNIEANTIIADSLILKGTDGLFYKLNTSVDGVTAEEAPTDGLDGKVIVAESITADKLKVSDLEAFGATIGGFKITKLSDDGQPGAIHSILKDSVDSPSAGFYVDNDGQIAAGNDVSYIKLHKELDDFGRPILDENGEAIYKLEISSDSILFGDKKLSSMFEQVEIGTYVGDDGDAKPSIRLYETDSDDKPETIITNEVVSTDLVDTKEVRQGNFAWRRFANGYGLMWIENEVTG